MKRLLLLFVIFLSFFFVLPVAPAHSQTPPAFNATADSDRDGNPDLVLCPTGTDEEDKGFSELCDINDEDVGGLVSFGVNILLVIAVVIALFFLIWGGIRWILSGGDKGAVEAARNTIIAAIVGLVLAFLAFFILNIVLQFFDIDLNKLEVPSLNDALD